MTTVNPHTPGMEDVPGEMLTLPEAAALLRVSVRTMRTYISTGVIPEHLYSRSGGYTRGHLRFTNEQVREIQKSWAGGRPAAPTPTSRSGVVPYRPRKRSE